MTPTELQDRLKMIEKIQIMRSASHHFHTKQMLIDESIPWLITELKATWKREEELQKNLNAFMSNRRAGKKFHL